MKKLEYIEQKRAKTFATTFRGDVKTFATLAQFFRDEGPLTRASVLRLTVESLRDMIIKQRPELEVKETDRAVEILDNLGLFNHDDRRGKSHLIEQLRLEDIEKRKSVRDLVSDGKMNEIKKEMERRLAEIN